MKAAVITILLCFLFVNSIFVSRAEATDVAQDKPVGGQEYGAELASGTCIHSCCARHFYGKCKVCCASAEEAKAFAMEVKGRLGVRGGQAKP